MRLDGDLGGALLTALDGADEAVRVAAGKYGLPAAARTMLKAVRRKAPVGRKGRARAAAVARSKRRRDRRARPLKQTGYVSRLKPNADRGDADWGAAFGFSAYHARLVELGHDGPKPAPPHPYFAPAALSARGDALAAAADATDDALRRLTRAVARKSEAILRLRSARPIRL